MGGTSGGSSGYFAGGPKYPENFARGPRLETNVRTAKGNLGGKIKDIAVCWSVAMVDNQHIDSMGIVAATRLAMQNAINGLKVKPEHLLIDAVKLGEVKINQNGIIHGDAMVLSISAASVLAKTARDAVMCKLGEEYPGYGFARHKGYGTKVHRNQLEKKGQW